MIKSNELRIGNSILQDGELVFVTPWRLGLIELDSVVYEPIPLTEEWLIKFGFFEKYKSTSNRWNIGGFELHDCEDDDGQLQGVFLYDFRLEVKYVHQLQNLYFALTGKELEIKK